MAVVDHFDDSDGCRSNLQESSSSFVAHISQPKLEAMLRRAAMQCALPPSILRGELVGLHVHDDHVESLVKFTGGQVNGGGGAVAAGLDHEVKTFKSQFVVGADGARSAVRTLCKLGMRERRGLESFISLHFKSPSLWLKMRGRSGMLYFIFNSLTICCVVAHDLVQGEWVAQVSYMRACKVMI